jgi:trans-feruloyl-CoA hydratase/vanillin synthase
VSKEQDFKNIKIERENGVTFVILNRPEKRNAMSPELHREMCEALDELETDEQTKAVVITGAGESFSAGQDIKLYFRSTEDNPKARARARHDSHYWRWEKLSKYAKPTIAMVNGFCFGGAFSPLVACDLAIAADDAVFGLSEVNWGIPPGNLVSKAVADTMGHRQALHYIMTGETFTGRQAAEMGLINRSVPKEELRDAVIALARNLLEKNPVVLRYAKQGFKRARELTWEQGEDYLYAKTDQSNYRDPEKGRKEGLKQFLDDKTIKPGLQAYKRG